MHGGKCRITSCFSLIIWVFREMRLLTLADGQVMPPLPITAWPCSIEKYTIEQWFDTCLVYKLQGSICYCAIFITHLLLLFQKCKLLLHFVISSFQESNS